MTVTVPSVTGFPAASVCGVCSCAFPVAIICCTASRLFAEIAAYIACDTEASVVTVPIE